MNSHFCKFLLLFLVFCSYIWNFLLFLDFFLKCVSRIPSVRILKKAEFREIYEKERRKKEDLYSASSFGFFQCKKPINYNMTANMWYKQWHMNTWTTIRKGAIFKIRSHVWSKLPWLEKISKLIFKWWHSQFNYKNLLTRSTQTKNFLEQN